MKILTNVTASGCIFEIYKLNKAGKNALDFYIASRLGELIGEGYKKTVVIVSNDSEFRAVQDYWEKRENTKKKVLYHLFINTGYEGQIDSIF